MIFFIRTSAKFEWKIFILLLQIWAFERIKSKQQEDRLLTRRQTGQILITSVLKLLFCIHNCSEEFVLFLKCEFQRMIIENICEHGGAVVARAIHPNLDYIIGNVGRFFSWYSVVFIKFLELLGFRAVSGRAKILCCVMLSVDW